MIFLLSAQRSGSTFLFAGLRHSGRLAARISRAENRRAPPKRHGIAFDPAGQMAPVDRRNAPIEAWGRGFRRAKNGTRQRITSAFLIRWRAINPISWAFGLPGNLAWVHRSAGREVSSEQPHGSKRKQRFPPQYRLQSWGTPGKLVKKGCRSQVYWH